MAQDGILTNIDALQDALRVYGLVVKKEADLAIRSKMADLAFAAAKNTKYAERASIRSQLSNLPITKDGANNRTGKTQYVGLYKLMNWERKIKGLRPLGNSRFRKATQYIARPGSMTIEERIIRRRNKVHAKGPSMPSSNFMDGKYKMYLKKREESSKFLRIGWARAAEFFGKPFRRGRDFGPKTQARISGEAYGAASVKQVGGDLTEYAMSNYAGRFDVRYRRVGETNAPMRSSRDQERAATIIEAGFNLGLQEVFADITKYFETRMPRVEAAIARINKLR